VPEIEGAWVFVGLAEETVAVGFEVAVVEPSAFDAIT
jgi:hypothetical protein